ncbi:MAG TPA: Xaa-Pro dipeptidase, partial [Thermoanaerobacterales bacterium]|nr:Xaa-Pro dipeptidase [Thermoanaerobacterales bacterium]
MQNDKYDSFLITNPKNIYYISGFTGTSAVLFITTQENFLITDFRYIQQANEQASNFNIIECKNNLWDLVMGI